MKILLFDVGGTNIRLALTNGSRLERPTIQPVPKTYRAAITLIAAVAKKNRVKLIIGGLPGPLDRQHRRMTQSTNLPAWAGRPFQRDVARRSGARVVLENDSTLVALGESSRGAGRGASIVAYIGFGTGIGGARVVDGRIDRNANGFEPGHHIVEWTVRRHRHPSPHPGDWEGFLSGQATFIKTGRPGQSVRDRRFWQRMEERAAVGLINVAMFWSPDVIVIGGSLMKKMSMAEIRRIFRSRQKIFVRPPFLRRATLGDFGGLYGALMLYRQLFQTPKRR